MDLSTPAAKGIIGGIVCFLVIWFIIKLYRHLREREMEDLIDLAARNVESLEEAKRLRMSRPKRWTYADLTVASYLSLYGEPSGDIEYVAERMGRSESSVKRKIQRLRTIGGSEDGVSKLEKDIYLSMKKRGAKKAYIGFLKASELGENGYSPEREV